jgi:hypothetical protein
MDDGRSAESIPEPADSTREYTDGTGEYSSAEEKGDPSAENREFWKRLGFGTFREYISYLNRMQEQLAPLPRTARPPAPDVSGLEGAEIEPPRSDQLRRRQVNVKLREGEAEDLDRAARIYGLTPSTLARVLVNRGVAGILEKLG